MPDLTVKQRRERLGIDKRRLARLAGVDRNTLSNLEDGKGVRVTTLRAIERALDAAEVDAGLTPLEEDQADETIEIEVVLGDRLIVRGPKHMSDALADTAANLARRLGGGVQATVDVREK